MGLSRSSPQAFEIAVKTVRAKSRQESFNRFHVLCDRIVDLTPVDSGELRANYDIRYGLSPSKTSYEFGRTSPTGPVLSKPVFSLEFNPLSQEPLVIGSPVPYVLQIEFGSWSAKAPFGMINMAIGEVYGPQ